MIRWRSSSPNDIPIGSSVRFTAALPQNAPAKTGEFGDMSGSNCEQPMFQFAGPSGAGRANLVDVYYELKFWQAAP